MHVLLDFDYHLPEDLIAQTPLPDRAASRMLVLHRDQGKWEDRLFREIPQFMRPGDCLVLNDSRVFHCRLYGRRAAGSGRVEVLLLRPISKDGRNWQCLVRPGRKMRSREIIHFEGGLEAEIIGRGEFGERTLHFRGQDDLYRAFEKIGHIPLPPYIKRPDEALDRERYQTVYARDPGSAAAPTAGLHFTPEILDSCRAAGTEVAYVTLHVGLGTFQPLHEWNFEQGRLHPEIFRITQENASKMRFAERLVAVGTTAVRTLETVMLSGKMEDRSGDTDIFIQPGFQFLATSALLTNFHLPRTSLIMLVCAFGGRQLVLSAYQHAIEKRYRFYSYGDCMLIL